jgi:hypothetical protein
MKTKTIITVAIKPPIARELSIHLAAGTICPHHATDPAPAFTGDAQTAAADTR